MYLCASYCMAVHVHSLSYLVGRESCMILNRAGLIESTSTCLLGTKLHGFASNFDVAMQQSLMKKYPGSYYLECSSLIVFVNYFVRHLGLYLGAFEILLVLVNLHIV